MLQAGMPRPPAFMRPGHACGFSSEGSRLDDVHAHLAGVGGLQLHLDAVQLPLEPVLGARVQHLAPHPRCIWGPAESLMRKHTGSAFMLFLAEINLISAH